MYTTAPSQAVTLGAWDGPWPLIGDINFDPLVKALPDFFAVLLPLTL